MENIMKVRKIIMGAATAMLACVMCVGLVGCGGDMSKTVADNVKSDVDAQMTAIENLDDDTVAKIMEEAGLSGDEFDEYGVSTSDFMKAWLSGMTHEVTNVDVSEDCTSATATVTVNCKQISSIVDDWTSSLDEALANVTSQEEVNSVIGETLMNALNNGAYTTTEVELSYVAEDGVVSLVDDTELQSALVG